MQKEESVKEYITKNKKQNKKLALEAIIDYCSRITKEAKEGLAGGYFSKQYVNEKLGKIKDQFEDI